jgi:hypothetical protein
MSNDLSELFDRDPLHLTDSDIAKIVARMRENHTQYELGAPKTPKAPPKKSTKTQDLLKDLGLT